MSISPEEARGALAAAQAGHRAVTDEVGAPGWYWWGLGLGWVLLGVITTYGPWWLTIVATVVFGAAHSAVFPWVTSARHRTDQVSVRQGVVAPGTMLTVWLGLLALIAVGVAFALALAADGSQHPAVAASLLPAALAVAGGPRLLAWAARRGGATS